MEQEKSHSKFGIAICLISSVSFLIFLFLGALVLAGSLKIFDVPFILIVPQAIHFAFLVLSLIGLMVTDAKKSYLIWGSVLNLVFFIISFAPWIYFMFFVKIRVL